MIHLKRTKIIATLGPGVTQKIWDWSMYNDPANAEKVKLAHENMRGIIDAGATTVRLNFSHGSREEQEVRIHVLREEAKKANRNISILLDTKGPEIRIGEMVEGEGSIVKAGNKVAVYCREKVVGDANKLSAFDASGKYDMSQDVKVGGTILVDDGKLALTIDSIDSKNGIIHTTAQMERQLITNKRINLPNTKYTIPFLSEKDISDIKFACEQKLDYIALSFVNNVEDVLAVRELTKKFGHPNINLMSKIESTYAVENVDAIIDVSDSVMVARGDLGLEIPFYDVPYWQKYIVRRCRKFGKPVVVATQMLDSLEKTTQPTRAEVTDVNQAVWMGTDSTMLSGETANGLYPVNAVATMSQINITAESTFDYEKAVQEFEESETINQDGFGTIAAKIAKEIAPDSRVLNGNEEYDYIVLFTSDDANMVREMSSARPAATILLITDNKALSTAFGVSYGVQTWLVDDLKAVLSNEKSATTVAKEAIKSFGSFAGKSLVLSSAEVQTLKH